MAQLFNLCVVVLLCVLKSSLASPSAEEQFAFQQVYDAFADSETRSFKSDGSAGSVSCPSGKKIVWGFKYHISSNFDSSVACSINNNGHCETGATSCSISECKRSGKAEENGILIVCASTVIPTSKAYSLSRDSSQARSVSCGSNEKIIWGFSYHHMRSYDSPLDNECMKTNYGLCDNPFTSTCNTARCEDNSNNHEGLVLMYILCAKDPYVSAIEKLTTFTENIGDGETYTVECPSSKPNLLTGVVMSFANEFDSNAGEDFIRPFNSQCSFETGSSGSPGDCYHGKSDTPSDDESFLSLLCSGPRPNVETPTPTSKPTTKVPTRAPTKFPTDAPTKFPTRAPTKFPTDAPTKFPTRAPTKFPTDAPTKFPTQTGSPTSFPTDAPTKFPTQTGSPTSFPTDAPTKFPTDAPTKFPTDAPSKYPTTNNPSETPTVAPTKLSTGSPTNSTIPDSVPTASPTAPGGGDEEEEDDEDGNGALILIASIAGAGAAMLFGAFFGIRRKRKHNRDDVVEASEVAIHKGDSMFSDDFGEAKYGYFAAQPKASFASSVPSDPADYLSPKSSFASVGSYPAAFPASFSSNPGNVPVANEHTKSVHLPVTLPRKLTKNRMMVRPESRDTDLDQFATGLAQQVEADDTLPRKESHARMFMQAPRIAPPPGMSPVPHEYAQGLASPSSQPKLRSMLQQQPELKTKIRSMFHRGPNGLQGDNPMFGMEEDDM